jgi:O-antigen ligase
MFISWSGSRASLIGIGIGSMLAFSVVASKPDRKRSLLALCVTLFGITASLPVPNPAPEFGLLRMVEATTSEKVSSGRTDMWLKTLAEIQSKPLIGHGAGSFRQNMNDKYNLAYNQPHQFILQYLYDWGLVGGLPALYLIALLGYRVLCSARHSPSTPAFLGLSALTTTTAIAMIDGALYSPLSIALTLIMLIPLLGRIHDNPVTK